MWRGDAARSAQSPQALPETLHVQWTRHLPPLRSAFRQKRLQFDAGYEPIIAGGKVLVASSRSDSVAAFSLADGSNLWTFHTGGPVRFAPAVEDGRVFLGSDDGYLYCLSLADGTLQWRFRAVPSNRKLLGNRRVISVWPVRGGPVVQDGRVYFAAGVLPLEGAFVYALDAATGETVWECDALNYIYEKQPHSADAFGGLSPQGYLLIHNGELIIPSSASSPARLDLETGKVIRYEIPDERLKSESWFAAVHSEGPPDTRRWRVASSYDFKKMIHETGPRGDPRTGVRGIHNSLHAAGQKVAFSDPRFNCIDGSVHSVAIAGERIVVVTREGGIHCLSGEPCAKPVVHGKPVPPGADPDGYVVVYGLEDGKLLEKLARETNYHIVAADPSRELIGKLRRRFIEQGLYGHRIHLMAGTLDELELPKWVAESVRTERPELRGELDSLRRPTGGADYNGDFTQNDDPLVRSPFGVLWFDDNLGLFKRSPQPRIVGSTMVSVIKDWSLPRADERAENGEKVVWRDPSAKYSDYPLLPPVLSDIYNGRILGGDEQVELRKAQPAADPMLVEPVSYPSPMKSQTPGVHFGTRINPLTGKTERRNVIRSYGCAGPGMDYGTIIGMRSGTAAYYDKSVESGTVNISGPRSGCTESVIPAGGLLNLPFFAEGCSCAYPLPSGMALVSMPETFEQWAAWGECNTNAPIRRIGINFGAPGDRVTRDGTLWLDYPSVGGPSPIIDATHAPAEAETRYRHSIRMRGGDGWPWVCASGIEGMRSFRLAHLKRGTYTVRLFFAEPVVPSDRVQTLRLNGKTVLKDFNVRAEAGGVMRGIVKELDGVKLSGELELDLVPEAGETWISGIEIILGG